MTNETKETTPEPKKQELSKAVWHHCVPVKVEKVVMERTGKNHEFVFRVRLETDIGNITHKPRNRKISTSELGGIATEDREVEIPTTADFITNNRMLVQLSKNCKDKPQEIILSYAEASSYNVEQEEDVFYKYMFSNQFSSIYYDKVHGKDTTETLDKQKEIKKKYAETEV